MASMSIAVSGFHDVVSELAGISDSSEEHCNEPERTTSDITFRKTALPSPRPSAPRVSPRPSSAGTAADADEGRSFVQYHDMDPKTCPGGCGFQITWHETHCCDKCAKTNGGTHGPKC